MTAERAVVRWVAIAATAVTLGLVLIPPAAWLLLSWERAAGALEAEVELASWTLTQVVSADPDLWEFESSRVSEHLARRARDGVAERRRVLDATGAVVAESSDPVAPPLLTRRLPLFDAGVQVGTIEFARSLRPFILRSGALLILLLLPAALAFRVLWTVPTRALRQSRAALRHQRDAAKQVLDVAGVSFVILDAGGRVTQVNRKGVELLGREAAAVVGHEWMTEHVDPGDRARVEAALASARPGAVVELEFPVARPDGELRVVHWYATRLAAPEGGAEGDPPPGLILSGADITRQRELEEQLAQSQKLRAIGQLAGGVAHDFNNILASIKGRASILRSDLEVGSPHRLDAEEILGAVDRAAALTRSLLTFSRRQERRAEPVDLVEVVRRSQRLLRRQLPEDVALALDLPAAPLTVTADAAQLEQVLVNLVSNAREAIPAAGRIVVAAATVTLDPDAAALAGLAGPGTFAQLSITDDGVGMAAETRARSLEPFFTTKDVGKGSGLGLAVAFGVVEQHHGAIRIASEPGRGTTVRILLPLRDATPGA
ncbi:MAG TPA: ATP-binding protein [Anaeromyxobacteraceae bacterium]|nr:ATP-binding protein [Anaeromyxobacteraceae bacterium]